MKKSIILTLAALSVAAYATVASAANYSISHPFYTPDKGKVMNQVTYSYSHFKMKEDTSVKGNDQFFEDMLLWGLSKKFVVVGDVHRNWLDGEYYDGGAMYDKSCTNGWKLGSIYKWIDNGKTFLSVSGVYGQDAYQEMYKSVLLNARYGKVFGSVTPYLDVDYFVGVNQGEDNDGVVAARAMLYKEFNRKLNGKLGVIYSRTTDARKDSSWTGCVGLGYIFTDRLSFALDCYYAFSDRQHDLITFGTSENGSTKSKYTIKATMRMAF